MPTIWQQLGGTVYTGRDLSEETIRHFMAVGGKWICPWVYNDLNEADNRSLITKWRSMGLQVGGMFNCFGDDPHKDADNISKMVAALNLNPVILDLEASYQFPNPGCQLMPQLLWELRQAMPIVEIGVNTNGLNDSMIWNGGKLGYKASCWALKIRVCPQWYSGTRYLGSCWADPVCNMTWLQQYGSQDNLYDPNQYYHRAVPFSYIHPCVEPTGVEGAKLQTTLTRMAQAQAQGLTAGFNAFVLERCPPDDLDLIHKYRGQLYL